MKLLQYIPTFCNKIKKMAKKKETQNRRNQATRNNTRKIQHLRQIRQVLNTYHMLLLFTSFCNCNERHWGNKQQLRAAFPVGQKKRRKCSTLQILRGQMGKLKSNTPHPLVIFFLGFMLSTSQPTSQPFNSISYSLRCYYGIDDMAQVVQVFGQCS